MIRMEKQARERERERKERSRLKSLYHQLRLITTLFLPKNRKIALEHSIYKSRVIFRTDISYPTS